MRRAVAILVCAALSLLARLPALAAANCTVTPGSMIFGSYDPLSGNATTSTASISYRCTGNAASITIEANGGSNGTVAARNLKRTTGSDLLPYKIGLTAAVNPQLGDGTLGTTTFTQSNPPNGTQNLTVFGQIPGGADVSVGSYADTVVFTIIF